MKRPLPQPRTRLLVVGKTGAGKSSEVKEALRQWLTAGVRIVALDVCDEYSRDGRETGLVRLGPLRKRVRASELAAHPAQLLDSRLSLAVVPDEKTAHAAARAFLLLAALLRHAPSRTLFVADEVGFWTDGTLGPAPTQAQRNLVALATNGRHDGIALVMVAQRASQVPKSARAQCTEIWAFRQDDPEDVAALAERIGKRAEDSARLQVGESVEWRDDEKQQDKPQEKLKLVEGA